MSETDLHFEARVLLYQSLQREYGQELLVTSDQFLFWDPTDPGQRLAPDIAIRVGPRRGPVPSWKTWERGAPDVAIEIVSDSDRPMSTFADKLDGIRRAGIREVVRFDARAAEPLRFWDLIDGDLVERDRADPEALRCDALGLYWCVRKHAELGLVLRLSRDASGRDILLTAAEAERAAKDEALAAKDEALAAKDEALAAKDAALAAKDAALAVKDAALAAKDEALAAKDAALARIAELEAKLAGRS